MGMTIDEKIEEDLKHCSLNGVKYSDYVNEHYISKDQYEQRLKADMVAMLTDLQLEIEEKATEICDDGWWLTYNNLIQEKIEQLKGE